MACSLLYLLLELYGALRGTKREGALCPRHNGNEFKDLTVHSSGRSSGVLLSKQAGGGTWIPHQDKVSLPICVVLTLPWRLTLSQAHSSPPAVPRPLPYPAPLSPPSPLSPSLLQTQWAAGQAAWGSSSETIPDTHSFLSRSATSPGGGRQAVTESLSGRRPTWPSDLLHHLFSSFLL